MYGLYQPRQAMHPLQLRFTKRSATWYEACVMRPLQLRLRHDYNKRKNDKHMMSYIFYHNESLKDMYHN
jgi:hypothetical protein